MQISAKGGCREVIHPSLGESVVMRRSVKRGSRSRAADAAEGRKLSVSGREVADLTHALREHSAALAECTRALQAASQELRQHGRS
jgi:hypothetical protein